MRTIINDIPSNNKQVSSKPFRGWTTCCLLRPALWNRTYYASSLYFLDWHLHLYFPFVFPLVFPLWNRTFVSSFLYFLGLHLPNNFPKSLISEQASHKNMCENIPSCILMLPYINLFEKCILWRRVTQKYKKIGFNAAQCLFHNQQECKHFKMIVEGWWEGCLHLFMWSKSSPRFYEWDLHVFGWCKISPWFWSSSDVVTYPTKCRDVPNCNWQRMGGKVNILDFLNFYVELCIFQEFTDIFLFQVGLFQEEEVGDHRFSWFPDN